jgi:hypothetical protein
MAADVAISFERAGAAVGDLMDMSAIAANPTVAGNQAFVFGGARIGQFQVINSGAGSVMLGNTNADATFAFRVVTADFGFFAGAHTVADASQQSSKVA